MLRLSLYLDTEANCQLIFVGISFALMIVLVAQKPAPAYPPGGKGDHGLVPFLILTGALGIVSSAMSFLSNRSCWYCLDRIADKGLKRRALRYMTVYIDVLFMAIAGSALFVSKGNCPCGD